MMAAAAARLRQGLEEAEQNEMFRQLVDPGKVRAALPLLDLRPAEDFDHRLVTQIHQPYRLAEFLNLQR